MSSSYAWLRQIYWQDAACTIYAGEVGSPMNICIPQTGGTFAKVTYTYATGVYSISIKHYTDSACQNYNGDTHPVTMNAACTDAGGYYMTGGGMNTPPTSFPVDGAWNRLYNTMDECNDQSTNGMSEYIFMGFNTNVCFPYVNGMYTSPTSCNSGYTGHSPTTCTTYSTGNAPNYNVCSSPNYYSTQTDYLGSDEVVCYSVDGGSGGGNGGGSGHAAVIAVAVAVPLGVIFIAGLVYYFFFMKKAGGLLAGVEVPTATAVPAGGSAGAGMANKAASAPPV